MLIGAVLLYVVAMAIFFYSANDATPGAAWPSLTMIYELGDPSPIAATATEVHRLDYRSATEWTDTIVEAAPTQMLGSGAVSKVDSYRRVTGSEIEEYNSIHDETTVKDAEDTTLVPHPFLRPMDITELKNNHNLTPTATASKVCYLTDCAENAPGLTFTKDGAQWTIANDPRWAIPIQVGDAFRVRELRIDAGRE
jgi:hypothetical protein